MNALQQLVHDEGNLALGQTVLVEVYLQVATRYLFHDYVDVRLTLEHLFDFDDVFVRYRTTDLNFLTEPSLAMISQIGLVNLFDGHYFLGGFVSTLEYC